MKRWLVMILALSLVACSPVSSPAIDAPAEAPPGAEAPSESGDVLAEFTIELTVAEGQPPPIVTDITLWKLDGSAYAAFNSRFVWSEIPQYTEHIEPFVVANEGESDIAVTICVVGMPAWAIIEVVPDMAMIYAGSSADFEWILTIDGEAPIGAQGFITVSLVQG